jgi:hypothetical protein
MQPSILSPGPPGRPRLVTGMGWPVRATSFRCRVPSDPSVGLGRNAAALVLLATATGTRAIAPLVQGYGTRWFGPRPRAFVVGLARSSAPQLGSWRLVPDIHEHGEKTFDRSPGRWRPGDRRHHRLGHHPGMLTLGDQSADMGSRERTTQQGEGPLERRRQVVSCRRLRRSRGTPRPCDAGDVDGSGDPSAHGVSSHS